MSPTYNAKCTACENVQEYQAKMSEREEAAMKELCTKCGQSMVHSFTGATGGFILKGTGWYKTDYPKGGR